MSMDQLQLGLSLLPSSGVICNTSPPPMEVWSESDSNHHFTTTHDEPNYKKRRFCPASTDRRSSSPPPETLPLLWSDDHGDKNPGFSLATNSGGEEEEEEEGVVGWPPVKWRRKRVCGDRTVENGCECGGRVSRFMYVKVKMEGVGIARKVDLTLHSSFHTLITTLMTMFAKCHEDSQNYKLTYQDREGDWLLAHDVSWRTFIRSVQRLKLVRRNRQWNL